MLDFHPADWHPLASILGQTDAIFAPVRNWYDGSASNAHIARRQYPDAGVRWDDGGGSATERKQRQRWLEDAARRGLVERFSGGLYTVRVRLAEAAELATRERCVLPGLAASASLVREVGTYQNSEDAAEVYGGAVWVSEWPELCGRSVPVETTPDDRRIVEEMAYPTLLRGWLVSSSDTKGLVAYRVGTLPDVLPEEAEYDDDAFDAEAREVWAAALRGRLSQLATVDDASRRELGGIPLVDARGLVLKPAAAA